MTHSYSDQLNHDTTEPRPDLVQKYILFTLLFVIFSFILGFYIYESLKNRELDRKENASVYFDRDSLDSIEEDILTSYYWVDQSKTLVRVPVEIAMRDMVLHAK